MKYELKYDDSIFTFRPNGTWILLEKREDGYAFKNNRGLIVIISIAKEWDDKIWIHVSLSRSNRMPGYDDISLIKHNFIGRRHKGIMVFPEDEKKVNMHPYCLHLFHCLGKDPLPDFTQGGDSL